MLLEIFLEEMCNRSIFGGETVPQLFIPLAGVLHVCYGEISMPLVFQSMSEAAERPTALLNENSGAGHGQNVVPQANPGAMKQPIQW